MKARCQKLVCEVRNRSGFTLIEMLIVIIILGILAMVIIPQITVSTDDAKVSTLKTSITGMRSSIEVYYAQHNNTYPGMVLETDGTTATTSATAVAAFTKQLTQFTNDKGVAVATKDLTHALGPYIKGGVLPTNPFKDNTLVCDIAVVDITLTVGAKRAADGSTGWKYLPVLGVIFANDEVSGLDEATKVHKTY
jgi:prepilin-type N-terminal cleavage/methylation domain-containing protein